MAELTPVHRFVDPGLNYLFTKNYNLSIRILPDGFSYAVTDIQKERLICLEQFSFNSSPGRQNAFGSKEYVQWLDTLINQCYLLKETFNKVFTISGGSTYTILPVPLYDQAHAQKFLEFNHLIADEDAVITDLIRAPEFNLIYSLPYSLKSWIGYNYPSAMTFHVCSSLIRSFFLHFRAERPLVRMLANIQKDLLDIVIIKGSDFRYCNTFQYHNSTDLLYYLLFVLEQLKINAEDSFLYLSGLVERDDEMTRLLSKYIRNVDIIPVLNERFVNPNFEHAPYQRFYDLINVELCG